MQIGDAVLYQGKQYILRGLDSMGVAPRRVEIEDEETGERFRVPVADVTSA